MKALMHKRPFVTNKKLPFLRRFSLFVAQRRVRNARDTRVTVDETQVTMGMRKMRGEDVSPVFSMPPSFARKFSVKGRRLGTRQNQKHIYASVTKPPVSLPSRSLPLPGCSTRTSAVPMHYIDSVS